MDERMSSSRSLLSLTWFSHRRRVGVRRKLPIAAHAMHVDISRHPRGVAPHRDLRGAGLARVAAHPGQGCRPAAALDEEIGQRAVREDPDGDHVLVVEPDTCYRRTTGQCSSQCTCTSIREMLRSRGDKRGGTVLATHRATVFEASAMSMTGMSDGPVQTPTAMCIAPFFAVMVIPMPAPELSAVRNLPEVAPLMNHKGKALL